MDYNLAALCGKNLAVLCGKKDLNAEIRKEPAKNHEEKIL